MLKAGCASLSRPTGYEYFHGDNGAGLGASHQTGWTGFIAKQLQFFGLLDPTFLARRRSTDIFYPEST